MLKKVVTSLFATSADGGRVVPGSKGEIGSILTLLGIFTEERRRGAVSPPSLTSLLKDPPLEVRLAEPMLTSTGEISSWMEGRLGAPMSGSIFLDYSSRKDFFLVCWMKCLLRRRAGWSTVRAWARVYYWPQCSSICRDGLSASASGIGFAAPTPSW